MVGDAYVRSILCALRGLRGVRGLRGPIVDLRGLCGPTWITWSYTWTYVDYVDLRGPTWITWTYVDYVDLRGATWTYVDLCGPTWPGVRAGAGRREPGGGRREVYGKSGASAAHTHTHKENCYPALREDYWVQCLSSL